VIPRTKVSYRLVELARALVTSERSSTARDALVGSLGALFANPNVVLTASGRGALFVLLSVLPQKKVLVPAYTCKAVVEAAHLAGKEIVYGESESEGFNMAAESLAGRLDADTVLIATHQFGIPCAIEQMVELARAADAFVIEDAAASLGTRVGGRLTGTFGDAAIFSFDSSKLVNVPLKGGFLLVRDRAMWARCLEFVATATRPMTLARKARYLAFGAALLMIEQPWLYRLFHNVKFRWRGRFTDDSAELSNSAGPFYTDRLGEWQAAILLQQLARLDELIAGRRALYAEYLERLRGAVGYSLPPADARSEWAPIRFPILARGDKLAFYRRAAERGVDFAFSFTFIASPPAFGKSHALANSVLDLPFYERLSARELERVAGVLKQIDQDPREKARAC
jgi:dTDP-4-amino-4,6-dideoxygalactose transaminase